MALICQMQMDYDSESGLFSLGLLPIQVGLSKLKPGFG